MTWGYPSREQKGPPMKTGRSLIDLATEIERQRTTRKDYLADTKALEMEFQVFPPEKLGTPLLMGLNGKSMPLRPHAHNQIASDLGIPKAYYDKMLNEAPELLTENVNTWLGKNPSRKLVRTLDSEVRGWLSNKYRPLDNFDLFEAAVPTLTKCGTHIVSCELTETRLYIKAVLPTLQTEIRGSKQKGDLVQAGVVISNSEVGAGSVRVEPLIMRLVCLNGMIAPDSSLKKYHIGKGADVDGVRELLTDEAKRADDAAFWLKVRDVVRGSFDEIVFRTLVGRIEEAAHMPIVGKLPEVVEVTADRFGFQEDIKDSVLRHLIEGGDLSRWGLVNAVTATANHQNDYERATDLERAGGKILELSQQDWSRISEAA